MRRALESRDGARAAAAALCVALAAGVAAADVLHLKGGGRIEGKIVAEDAATVRIETRVGTQAIDRARIERIELGETAAEQIARRREALAPSDVEGRWQLAAAAGEAGLRALRDELHREILGLDPMHEGVNRFLGHVLHGGAYVTPEERDRLVGEERAAEMRAQGLVEHDGRFVTPNEKEKLAQGLVQQDGRWMSEAEAKLADGLVRGADGAWVRIEDAALAESRAAIEKAVGHALVTAATEDVAVHTDGGDAFAENVAAALQKGMARFAGEFQPQEGTAWFATRKLDVAILKTRRDYEAWVAALAAEDRLGTKWAEAAGRVDGIYLFETRAAIATMMGNRGEAMTAAHCCNLLGHVLVNRYRCEGRPVPPLLDEAFAALTEYDLTGRNAFFSIGFGAYERTLGERDLAFFADGNWIEPLRDVMRELADLPFDQTLRREHSSLTQLDVAKAMALFVWLRRQDPPALKAFFDAFRDAQPKGRRVAADPALMKAVDQAFVATCGVPAAGFDPRLREFVVKVLRPGD